MDTKKPVSESVTVYPTDASVTVAEAKAQSRIEHTAEDALITAQTFAADAFCEEFTGLAIMPQTQSFAFDGFADALLITKGPLISIDSVTYQDEDGAEQTLATSVYVVEEVPGKRAVIRLASSESWPTLDPNSLYPVTVTGQFGHADADAVPATIKQAAKWIVAHLYQMREPEVTGTITNKVKLGVDSLLMPHVIW